MKRSKHTSKLNQPKVICFAGNPNVGKSSWINLLSDANFTIGNYPGVTVEKKEAIVVWEDQTYHLIDLPGTYSLYHGTNEETIAVDVLLNQKVDVIINVIDTTNFARNCELMLQLRELQVPMLVLLNYKDEALKQNIVITLNELQELLNIKAILCSAQKPAELKEIKNSIIELSKQSKVEERHSYYLGNHHAYLKAKEFIASLQTPYQQFSNAELSLYALKWCEQEALYVNRLKQWNLPMEKGYRILEMEDCSSISTYRMFLKEACVSCIHTTDGSRLRMTKQIDTLLLHSIFALPLFIVIMAGMFSVTFIVSQPITQWCDQFINQFLSFYITKAFSFLPHSIVLLIEKGLIQGVGGVLVFLPMLACLYFFLSVLEESGYFARVACLFDRIMRPFGMSGRSFVSLILGFGCNVPAILSTRTLHDSRAKTMTALIIPFMSCTARLPIYLIFAYAFFPSRVIWVVMTLYGIGCFMAFLVALLIHYCKPYIQTTIYTIELPPYRFPSLSFVFRKVSIELKAFIRKSFTIICSSMIVLFLLSYYPNGRLDDSYIIEMARNIAPVFEPLGFGNQIELVAALPGAIISKENVVGFLGQTLVNNNSTQPMIRTFSYDFRKQMHLLGDAIRDTVTFQSTQADTSDTLLHAIKNMWTDERSQLRAFSYLVYILLSIPCIMTMHMLYREYGLKLLLMSIGVMIVVPYVVSFLLFQGFSLLY